MKKSFIVFVYLLCSIATFGQQNKKILTSYLNENSDKLQLSKADIQGLIVTNEAYSERSKITHVYIQQTYNGIPIFNAVGNLAIREGKVIHAKFSFIENVAPKINSRTSLLDAKTAIEKAASQLKIERLKPITLLEKNSNNQFIYDKSGISQEKIPVELVYQPMKDGSLKLSWKLNIYQLDGEHWWNVRVDANTGIILEKNDWRIDCNFTDETGKHNHTSSKKTNQIQSIERKPNTIFAGSYTVFPIPVESPNHGNRSIVTNPVNVKASPFGWHDDNGVEGHEYTITRGNNVYAQLDDDGLSSTFGYSPDGGADLNFDFPLNLIKTTKETYTDASLTHLFYANNIIHDVLYQYGFDEVSGNFQANNYGKGGIAGDFMIADGQDTGRRNNASIFVTPEGVPPRMQMFLWNKYFFHINEGTLEGGYKANDSFFLNSNGFLTGVRIINNPPLTAELTFIKNGSSASLEACDPSAVLTGLTDKIVVLRRGNCSDVSKIELVQKFGAAGVIIVNNEPENFRITGTSDVINIPAISVSQEIGEPIISALRNNETMNITLGDFAIDSSFDTAVIAHEYAHGLSIRLVGGASNTDCLFNQEQLGEGWSDFLGLLLTMKESDTQNKPRGIGTFLFDQSIDDVGIREYPYSSNMSVNPFTFNDVQYQVFEGTEIVRQHGLGSIWATFLWDLNWSMIASYGFDPDFYNGTGGNNKTLELVIEGLKLTPCRSGFVDARDAILAADKALNGGANQCLIWQVFARRGLGYSASSGDPDSAVDQEASFDMPPDSVLPCVLNTLDLAVYPNPSKGTIKISGLNDSKDATITIYDLNGRLVFSDKRDLFGVATIETRTLRSGIYILNISSESISYKQKIIIE